MGSTDGHTSSDMSKDIGRGEGVREAEAEGGKIYKRKQKGYKRK